MKKVGIIAEFNPFHNGHKYLIDQAKKMTQADYVIIAMSGDFVQRGTPAFMDKYDRTKIALENGADLVLMLPVAVSTASAEGFATGAVKTLFEAGVDTLCFGVENEANISTLEKIADLLVDEKEEFKQALRNNIKEGYNFPVARAKALRDACGISDDELDFIESPNNQLAIEYIKSVKKLGFNMDFVAVKRADNGYHSTESRDVFASASYIRKGLIGASSCTEKYEISRFLPGYEIDRFVYDYNTRLNDFMLFSLLQFVAKNSKFNETNDKLENTDIMDLTSDLFDRIERLLPEYKDFHQFAALVKNKSITYTRVCRVLIHILLGIKSKDEGITHLRVLGIRESARCLLGELSKNANIPVVIQLSESRGLISKDLYAAEVYRTILGIEESELTRRLITVE